MVEKRERGSCGNQLLCSVDNSSTEAKNILLDTKAMVK